MSYAAAESYRILEFLTTREHRGRGDTWEAARGRVADAAGISLSYAARIWHRWRHMKKADGDALLALQQLEQTVSEARKEHAEYKAETARLVALARDAEADRASRMVPELGRRLGGVDRS